MNLVNHIAVGKYRYARTLAGILLHPSTYSDTLFFTLYIRIAKPDNEILTKNPGNQFKFEDRNISYSIKKYIEYTGEEQSVTVYWDVEEFLPAGTYHIYIFADGNMIGQGSFRMK